MACWPPPLACMLEAFTRVKEDFQTQTPSSSSPSDDVQTDEILTDSVARIGFTIKGGENIQIRRLLPVRSNATKTLLIHLLSSLLPGGSIPSPSPSQDLYGQGPFIKDVRTGGGGGGYLKSRKMRTWGRGCLANSDILFYDA